MSGTIGGGTATVTYSSSDNLSTAQTIISTISAGLASGAFTGYNYPGTTGTQVPLVSPGVAVLKITQPTSQPVVINDGYAYILVSGQFGLVLQGGTAGGTFIAGAGDPNAAQNISFTNIAPSGNLTDNFVVLGGNNLIQTTTSGAGNYNVATGSGNDTVNIFTGNGTVSAGTGQNQIGLGSGFSSINSVGNDTITGAFSGGGSDTVAITGQASINSVTSSFLVNDSSAGPVVVNLGAGVDTVNVTGGGPATVQGSNTTTNTSGNATVTGTITSTGDAIQLAGGASTVTAAGSNDTVTAVSGNNLLLAGTGNDTLVAGSGADTLTGGIGFNSSAFLTSGTGAGTTFSFTIGQSAGSDTISGFKSTDILSFSGYGTNPQATAVTQGASTILTLSDGTTLTLLGATPSAAQFVTR